MSTVNRKRIVIFTFILTLGIYGCEGTNAPEETIHETGLYESTYFNKELLINIDIPQNWITTLDTIIDVYPVLLYSEESDLNADNVSMNLILLDASAFSDAASFINYMKSSLQGMYPGVSFVSDTSFQIDGNSCVEIEYLANINSALMAQRQIFINSGSSLAIVTLSCGQTRYSAISNVFDDIQESISFE